MNPPNKKAAATLPLVRCAIYTRKSTEEGLEQEFNSLDAQHESAEAFIRSHTHEGWTCLPDRYDDGGFTGGNMERPALQRLLADIRAGPIDCVVTYKVDRLSRSLLDFAKMMETFEQHGVSFVSITQQFNSATSMGRLVLNVLLSFAQFEREIIAERTRDKMAATRRKGKWSGGTPCSATISTPAADDCTSTTKKPSVGVPSSPCTWGSRRCCRWCRSWLAAAGSASAGRRARDGNAAAGPSPRPVCTDS
jgi:DNA invertase Pin-like site-specific DNA recombinase